MTRDDSADASGGMYTTSEAAQQVCADLRSRDVQRVSAASDLSSACPHAIAGGASLLGMAMWHGGAAVSTFARHAYAALVPRALARVIPPQYLRCAGGHRERTAAACVAGLGGCDRSGLIRRVETFPALCGGSRACTLERVESARKLMY